MKEEEKAKLVNRINEALNKLRPYLEADGGNISLEEVTDDLVVKVKLHGACDGCPFSYQTLKAGVEQAIRKEIPEIKDLVAVN
ncbi:MAG: nitrogen fixation protein NifU [Bacteroides sp. SM23_62_1]|nr:MAG: nitrogen fixation protein NifU [Bacteroides sp. SM23_62_1]